MKNAEFDLVVFGATSFVGQILCHYLADNYGVNDQEKTEPLKWAIAGRSASKLEQVRSDLKGDWQQLPVIVADASDETALRDLCNKTSVVISTVGPYALYGEPLVKACAETGTDYCDLTGEPQWIRQMLLRYEDQARASGAHIVHCCGFDSIPSDLGTYYLQQEAQKRFGKSCNRVSMRVKGVKGGFSGGTAASLTNVVKQATHDAELRRELKDFYSLCPANHGNNSKQLNLQSAHFDERFDSWITPFVMASINTRVVLRSNALLDPSYDSQFCYDEAVLSGKGVKGWLGAQGMATGLALFVGAVAIKPTRWLLENYVLPKPGEGPSPEEQENGFYDLRFQGRTDDGQSLLVKVTGDRDPGYGSTAKMLAQAGISLAKDFSEGEKAGGFWTPASQFGSKLITRLEQHAGLTFSVI